MNDDSRTMPPPQAVATLLRGRRTIEDFKDVLPRRELILRALDAARWAPNHHVTEPWHFYLLGRATATAIAELNAAMIAARGDIEAAEQARKRWLAIPGWLVLTCENSEDPRRAREDFAACCCAAQNMMLYLWSEGIGVKWTTGKVTRDPRFYDLIWVDPAQETVVGLYRYGYPAEIPQVARKPVEAFLVDLP
ncbi:MAG: nitroreductase family protein [Chromatiales bacterium]